MKTITSYYMFEKISSNMAKSFGTIKIGQEEEYTMIMMPLEVNLIKMGKKTGINNGRRAIEAIKISLFTIDGYLNGWKYDFGEYLTPENQNFVEAVLMAVDPFTNGELYELLKEEYDLDSHEDLREYFAIPIKCILRVENSIQYWTTKQGASGYFEFMESHMKRTLPKDFKMDFAFEQRKEV